MATKSTATREDTKIAIVKMYQNGTTQKLSLKAQKAAHALAYYIYANKERKKFAFALGMDHHGNHLLLLTIANHSTTSQVDVSLQRAIQQVPTSTQKSNHHSLATQLSWVTNALQEVEFGILFWIYQNRLSAQEAIVGTTLVPAPIIAVNFQRAKTLQEQLQDNAQTKINQVVHNLTHNQLKISGNAQQLPSQTKITASHIMLAIQKLITNDDALSKATQKLIKEDNIEVELNDKYGKIEITIKNYGNDKTITIFGFKATGTPLELAQAKIDVAQDGANLPTKLNEVFHSQTPKASDVNAPTKNGVTFKFKLATAVNDGGASTLIYEVDANPQVKGVITKEVTFVVSDFETQIQAADRIAQLAQAAIQNLVASDFTTGINKAQIASIGKPLKAHIISDIKDQINNRDAQALILPSDITIAFDNDSLYVTIVINNHGSTKVITILGFRAIKDYLDQLLNAIPSSGGAFVIPEGISTSQFDAYVKSIDSHVHNEKFVEKYKTKITSLTIPNSFTTIGTWFRGFDKIVSLTISDSVTRIGNYAFNNSPLTTLALGSHLQTIGRYAFRYARLTSLRIPDSVITIGNYAFVNSPLTTLTLGDHLQTIGDNAFLNARLRSLIIPNSVTKIGVEAFILARLRRLSLGDHLQTIGRYAFFSAKLTSLTIPHSVTTIGSKAFNNSSITTITIFQDVKLGKEVFWGSVIIKRIPRPTS